jgi:amidohydrolase
MSDRTHRLARLAADLAPAMIELRRDLHRNPEVGWTEYGTTRRVAEVLTERGLTPQVREEGTGLIVEIGSGGPIVGFRADMDALPIQEEATPEYRSERDGVMHACGHDVHTAIGVGVASALAELGDVPGTVRVIFQPAEEQIPGGAVTLCAEGVHDGLSALIAFHVDPSLEPGNIGLRRGGITGASDRVVIRLHGPGGHTSRPHQTVDLIYVAGRVIANLPLLIRHGIDPRETVLVVFGRIEGGSAENVIPTTVELGGTIRLFDLDLWRTMPKALETVVTDLVRPLGATAEIEYHRGSPPVVNHDVVTGVVSQAAAAALGGDGVKPTHQSLGSEDFAWYLEQVPGALLRLGSALPDRKVDLHSATFDVDERAIETGILVGAEAMLQLLESAERGE